MVRAVSMRERASIVTVGERRGSMLGERRGSMSHRVSVPMIDPDKTVSILVGFRVRPLNSKEKGQNTIIKIKDQTVTVMPPAKNDPKAKPQAFFFDYPMDSTEPDSPDFCTQEQVHDYFGHSILNHVFEGYNAAFFAYGQTGTGKTTTVMGKPDPPSERGLLLRMVDELFDRAEQIRRDGGDFILNVQMLEVYNEQLRDLLAPSTAGKGKATKPKIHVHPKTGVYVQGVKEACMESASATLDLIEYGNTMKMVAATAMNRESSRAHTIVRFNLHTKHSIGDNTWRMAYMNIVDLAGRENERTAVVTGDRLVELSFINRSLMWLSQCIADLARQDHGSSPRETPRKSQIREDKVEDPALKNSDSSHSIKSQKRHEARMMTGLAKFRNSKLTLLLSSALSGNSRTAMIATASPAANSYDETMCTLNFAQTVKKIKLQATPQVENNKEELVESLRDEISQLKEQLLAALQGNQKDQLLQTKERIEAAEAVFGYVNMTKDEFQTATEMDSASRREQLEQIKTRPTFPYLTNCSDDPHLAGRLVIHIPEGTAEFTIGSAKTCNVSIDGLGILPITCYLRHIYGELCIKAGSEDGGRQFARVMLNQESVEDDWVRLEHDDVLEIGHAQSFVLKTRSGGSSPRMSISKARTERSRPFPEIIAGVIGRERKNDEVMKKNAEGYYEHLYAVASEVHGGESIPRAFLLNANKARKQVEEANAITREMKSRDLSFELSMVSPVLAFGYGHDQLPEFCILLTQRHSRAKQLWDIVRRSICNSRVLLTTHLLAKVGMSHRDEGNTVIGIWTYEKFESRLKVMRAIYDEFNPDDPNPLEVDPWEEAPAVPRAYVSHSPPANSPRAAIAALPGASAFVPGPSGDTVKVARSDTDQEQDEEERQANLQIMEAAFSKLQKLSEIGLRYETRLEQIRKTSDDVNVVQSIQQRSEETEVRELRQALAKAEESAWDNRRKADNWKYVAETEANRASKAEDESKHEAMARVEEEYAEEKKAAENWKFYANYEGKRLRDQVKTWEDKCEREQREVKQLRKMLDDEITQLRDTLSAMPQTPTTEGSEAMDRKDDSSIEVKRLEELLSCKDKQLDQAHEWQKDAMVRMTDMSTQLERLREQLEYDSANKTRATEFVLEQLSKVSAAHAALHGAFKGRDDSGRPPTPKCSRNAGAEVGSACILGKGAPTGVSEVGTDAPPSEAFSPECVAKEPTGSVIAIERGAACQSPAEQPRCADVKWVDPAIRPASVQLPTCFMVPCGALDRSGRASPEPCVARMVSADPCVARVASPVTLRSPAAGFRSDGGIDAVPPIALATLAGALPSPRPVPNGTNTSPLTSPRPVQAVPVIEPVTPTVVSASLPPPRPGGASSPPMPARGSLTVPVGNVTLVGRPPGPVVSECIVHPPERTFDGGFKPNEREKFVNNGAGARLSLRGSTPRSIFRSVGLPIAPAISGGRNTPTFPTNAVVYAAASPPAASRECRNMVQVPLYNSAPIHSVGAASSRASSNEASSLFGALDRASTRPHPGKGSAEISIKPRGSQMADWQTQMQLPMFHPSQGHASLQTSPVAPPAASPATQRR